MTVELGIFARTFARPTAGEVASAIADAGFATTQFNLSSIGLPTLPRLDAPVGLRDIKGSFASAGVHIWGQSATFNVVHPDLVKRHDETSRAKALIESAPELGAEVVTLCTGSRDPDNMWRAHPGNKAEDAWSDMRATLDLLIPAAQRAGVRLGIEPEPGNVVSDAPCARRLLDELGPDSAFVGIVLDPANLVGPATLADQGYVLRSAFALLGKHTVALHAKDVVTAGDYAAAGTGGLDYDLIFELHAGLPTSVPVIIQDAAEQDVARTRDFLLSRATKHHAPNA